MKTKEEQPNEAKDVLVKMAKFCAYQDRCKQEVYKKLDDLLPDIVQQDLVIEYLIEEKYLDEPRYVRAVVRGRFIYKHWGKLKIIHYLKQKDIDEALIDEVMAKEIDNETYYQKITELIQSKKQSIKGANDFEIKQKIIRSLFQKGYDASIVTDVLNDLERA
jgi:regulatory protein